MMTRRPSVGSVRPLVLAALALLVGACATASPSETARPTGAAPPSRPAPRPAAYESEDFVVTFAQPGDTPSRSDARPRTCEHPGKNAVRRAYARTRSRSRKQ